MKISILKSRQVVKKLRKAGFFKSHQKGSHLVMRHKSSNRIVVVPIHSGKDIPPGTLRNIVVKQAVITIEKFIKL